VYVCMCDVSFFLLNAVLRSPHMKQHINSPPSLTPLLHALPTNSPSGDDGAEILDGDAEHGEFTLVVEVLCILCW